MVDFHTYLNLDCGDYGKYVVTDVNKENKEITRITIERIRSSF